jgi:hypothetical protein
MYSFTCSSVRVFQHPALSENRSEDVWAQNYEFNKDVMGKENCKTDASPSPNIISVIKLWALRLVEHAACLGDTRNLWKNYWEPDGA